MSFIKQAPNPMADYPGFTNGGGTVYGSRITNLSSCQQRNTDITIMTAEGDRVTLSADSERQVTYSTYSGLAGGLNTMAQFQGRGYSMEVNQGLSITIEGNLSKEEFQDIKKSIRMIDKIIREALSGNSDHALTIIQDVNSMESIAHFSASVEIQNALTFTQQAILETQTPDSEPANETGSARDSLPPDRFDRMIDRIMDALKNHEAGNRKLIRPLNKYFSKLLKGISEKHEGSDKKGKMEMVHRIHSEILERMEQRAHEKQVPSVASDSEGVGSEKGLVNQEIL